MNLHLWSRLKRAYLCQIEAWPQTDERDGNGLFDLYNLLGWETTDGEAFRTKGA